MTEITKFNPCSEAVEFRDQFNSFQEAWNNCHRGDWMLWIAKRLDVDLKILTKAKAKCAMTVRHLMKDQRSINACEVALKFADGEATRDELNAAAAAAYAADAAYAAAAAAYADAAYAAADAAAAAAYAAAAAAAAYADAAYAAADAADAAAAAAAAYADAAYADAAYAAARIKNQKQTADICREILTESVFKALNIYVDGKI